MTGAMSEYTTAFSEGNGDFSMPDGEKMTANPARSYETFVRDFAGVFGPEAKAA